MGFLCPYSSESTRELMSTGCSSREPSVNPLCAKKVFPPQVSPQPGQCLGSCILIKTSTPNICAAGHVWSRYVPFMCFLGEGGSGSQPGAHN